jgi:hypothetical protein
VDDFEWGEVEVDGIVEGLRYPQPQAR